MGAKKICNGSGDVEEAGDGELAAETYHTSSISVDLSLPLPAMTPRIMFVQFPP